MVNKNSKLPVLISLLVLLAVGLFMANSLGYLSVVPLGEDVYIPHYAYVECVQGQSVDDSQSDVYVPEGQSSQILYCGYQSCSNIEIDTDQGWYTVLSADGIDYDICNPSQGGSNCYATWQSGGREGYNYHVTLPITLQYEHQLFAYSPDSQPITVQNSHYKVFFTGNKATLRTASSDPAYEGHTISTYNCDPGDWNVTEKDWYEKQTGHPVQFGSFEIGKRYYFVADYMKDPIALFENSNGQICFNDKVGWSVKDINGYKFLDTNSSTTPVEACSSSECQAEHGGDTAWFVTDDWICTTNQSNAQECTTDAEAGGLRCENKDFVYYACVNGKIVKEDQNKPCCNYDSDCPSGEQCANNVCVQSGAVSYPTCNNNQCCIGFMDKGYDKSLNSIYEHGRACPEGTYCNMAEGSYLGACVAKPPQNTTIVNKQCDKVGEESTCTVDNKPGFKVCKSDGMWSACEADAGNHVTLGEILLGVGGLFGIILLINMLRRKK